MVIYAYTEECDPDAKVIMGKISLSMYQRACLRDDGECLLTPQQHKIMANEQNIKTGFFPPGWGAFLNPKKLWEYVMEERAPDGITPPPTKEERESMYYVTTTVGDAGMF